MVYIQNILHWLHNCLIKFVGGATEEDVAIAMEVVREYYQERLKEVLAERDKARDDYRKATERIRHMMELEAFGYTKKDQIRSRRDQLLMALWIAMRDEAGEFFNKWDIYDENVQRDC